MTKILKHNQSVKNGTKSWNTYFKDLDKSEEYLADLIKNTEDVTKLTSKDLVQANQAARNSVLEHNQAIHQQSIAAKAGTTAIKGFALAGNMIAMWAISQVIQAVATAIDNYVNRLEHAKEQLSQTQTELSSLESQMEENTQKIQELESQNPSTLSIADQEDLQRLKAQNEELRIRQDYLKQQERADLQKVTDLTKEDYRKLYGNDNQNQIDAYRSLYTSSEEENKPTLPAYLTGETQTTSSAYAAAFSTELSENSNDLSNLIAQYEHFSEEKKKAIQEEDGKALEDYNQKLEKTEKKLLEHRRTLQGFYDDLLASGESSPELESIQAQLSWIDSLLLSPGQRLIELINTDFTAEQKESLATLAREGTLTQEALEKSFPKIDSYLKENGLTLEDLISLLRTYKEDLATLPVPSSFAPLSVSDTISQLNTQLQPAFDALGSAYQNIFTSEGFTLDNVDLPMLNSLQTAIEDMSEELNLQVDTSSFENLSLVLSQSSSTPAQVQEAFDSLASSLLFSSGVMDTLDESTAQLVTSLLESMGVSNAQELVLQGLEARMEGVALQERLVAAEAEAMAQGIEFNIQSFLQQAEVTTVAKNALFALITAEQVFRAQGLNISDRIAKLKELTAVYGQAGIASQIAFLEQRVQWGETVDFEAELSRIREKINQAIYGVNFQMDKENKTSTQAAQAAADAYLEAFEKELSELDRLKAEGKLSEKQYLDALRRLYLRYFKDKQKYLKEYAKYEHQYLDGMKSLYESAFSFITKQIDQRIQTITEEKEAALESLEAQKETAAKTIQAQIDGIETQIEYLDELIEKKQEEITAIQEAAAARERELNLQKAQYELERMQHQRTTLVYREGQGLVYEADTTGIREAREQVEDAKREIQIAAIETDIDKLEKQQATLEDQRQLLEQALEQSNSFYDNLISQTKTQYDSILENLEDYQSQWEKLSDLAEAARQENDLQELGISQEDIFSGSQEAFVQMMNVYQDILKQLYRENPSMLEQLNKQFTQIAQTAVSTQNPIQGTNTTPIAELPALTATAPSTAEAALLTPDFSYLRELKPGDRMYELLKKAEAYFSHQDSTLPLLNGTMDKVRDSLDRMTREVHLNMDIRNPVSISIGDINLHEVQNVDTFADELCMRLPNLMLQKTRSLY